jgi:hypothetical protein
VNKENSNDNDEGVKARQTGVILHLKQGASLCLVLCSLKRRRQQRAVRSLMSIWFDSFTYQKILETIGEVMGKLSARFIERY